MSRSEDFGGDAPRKRDGKTHYPALGCSHCPAAFFDEGRHGKHMAEQHPDQPRAESWESSEGHRVDYIPHLTRQHPHMYLLSDAQSGKYLSNMVVGHEGEVQGLETHPKHRRQGLASELWHAAQQHAEGTPGVPTPKHSVLRTRAGEGWAKKVGGEVPSRQGEFLSARNMQGMIDFKRQ